MKRRKRQIKETTYTKSFESYGFNIDYQENANP